MGFLAEDLRRLSQMRNRKRRLEGGAGGGSQLIARWSIVEEDRKRVLLMRKPNYVTPMGAKDNGCMFSAFRQIGVYGRSYAGL